MPNRAVFLDKDGTLIENVPYNVDPCRIQLLPGAAEGVRELAAAGYLLVVVSNQSGVARGLFGEEALGPVRTRVEELLRSAGARVAAFYYCPHHPEGTVEEYGKVCECRKPADGMLRQAARDLGLDLAQCWLAGDILDDVEAGNRAGCQTVLVDNGGETLWEDGPFRTPTLVAPDLATAARLILRARAEVAA